MPRLLAPLALAVGCAAGGSEPNPPTWPSSVRVFKASDSPSDVAAAVNAAYAENGGHDPPNKGQFSDDRFAFLFLPGKYSTDVPVGFYTQILGLGETADDVTFTGARGVYCEEGDYGLSGALVTFWRSAEGFTTQANFSVYTGNGMLWAVSQAAPLRRIHVTQNLILYQYEPPIPQAGYSSGGYFSDLVVDGYVTSGSQQQWFSRSSKIGQWQGGVWNMVYAGVQGAPAPHCGTGTGVNPYTVVDTLKIASGKPYIQADANGDKYTLRVPAVVAEQSGPQSTSGERVVDFSSVYVTKPSDTAADINAKLAAGLDIVITPGIYKIDAPLVVDQDNQIVLCLGLATLISSNGNPVFRVGNRDGVRLGGCLLQASPKRTQTLLQWGDGSYKGSATNPGFIHDVFARVGGPDAEEVFADTMFNISSGFVIGDNMWLWRADHSVQGPVTDSKNPCASGLVVSGDDVTMLGLAVEHTLGDMVSWSGERGETIFYQSELPYDVTQANFGDKKFAGYRVAEGVQSHSAYGLGVYHNFVADNVTVDSAIAAPAALEKSFKNSLSVFLSGYGVVKNVVNQEGGTTGQGIAQTAYLCNDERRPPAKGSQQNRIISEW